MDMGKKRREMLGIVRRDDTEGMIAKARRTIAEAKDDKRQEAAYRVRLKYAERWMKETEEVTGKRCESIADVDLSIPQIHIEWLLCDPVYTLKLKNKQVAHEFMQELNEEERELFWYRDEQGHSYSDLIGKDFKEELKALYSHDKSKQSIISGINTNDHND